MDYALFQVATKALIVKDSLVLTLVDRNSNIDFPGGRLNDTEYQSPFECCLERELKEELGSSFGYKIGGIVFVARRSYTFKGKRHYIVTIFHIVDYLSGEIKLSDEHKSFSWYNTNDLLKQKERFVSNSEYEELRGYLVI